MKAFNSVDWNFLFSTLGAMSFPMKFINWLKACITIPRYSIMINGLLCAFFEVRKGSRQGDPLFPYLFVIAMEVLSCMPNSAADNGVLSYNSRCSKIHLIHLCFFFWIRGSLFPEKRTLWAHCR